MANDKKQRVKLVSPLGRLSFPAIFEKEKPVEGSQGKPKYAATIIFDTAYLKKNPDELKRFNAIKAELDKACREKFKKPLAEAKTKIREFWDPIRDGEEKEHLDGYGKGTIFFKASSHRMPGAIMPDKTTPITMENGDVLYSGCYVRLSVSPYAFDKIKKGVGLGLNSVMLIKDGERLDGGSNPEEDFGEVDVDEVAGDPLDDGDSLL